MMMRLFFSLLLCQSFLLFVCRSYADPRTFTLFIICVSIAWRARATSFEALAHIRRHGYSADTLFPSLTLPVSRN